MLRVIAPCVTACALGLVASCYLGPVEEEGAAAPRPPDDTAVDGTTPPAPEGAAASGLPCEVHELLVTRCATCHGAPLSAPVRLLSYADLTGPSKSDPTRTLAEVAVSRMRSASSPMPPAPGAPANDAQITAVERWIAGGYPRGACAADAGTEGGSPPELTSVCTSGTYWSSGKKGVSMNPGRACIQCHTTQSDEGTIVAIGGTVYPTLREPDGCYGVNGSASDVRVVVTDASGKVFDLPVSATGNFALMAGIALATPFRAKVVAGGKERVMSTPQTSGDCNACHTETGRNGAPGRVAVP